MMGGLILGLVESLATTFFPATYKDVIAFVILILVLIFRPWGLMGERIQEKV
jgi:branched-chain amino acid transport system permease protein